MRTLELGQVGAADVPGRRLALELGAAERRVNYCELRDDPPPKERERLAWAAPVIRRSPVFVARALGEAVYPAGA
jgi:hypothetical protein